MSNTKQQGKMLPAAMMSLALTSSPLSSAVASVATAGADAGRALDAHLPVVMQYEANTKSQEPAGLRDFVKMLSAKTNYLAMRPEGRCGTISGSGNGWDDSKFDC
jgi:hypothetical protein